MYIYKAFQYAREAVDSPICDNQEIELIYNDTPILHTFWEEEDAPAHQNWGQGMFNLMQRLRLIEGGTELVDGVGIQAHLNYFPTEPWRPDPVRHQRQILEAFKGLQLSVRLTELDVSLVKKWSKSGRVPFSYEEVEEHFANDYFYQQAEVYRNAIHNCLYDEEGTYDPICRSITIWGLMDYQDSYNLCFYPRMFNQGKPKPYEKCRGIRPVEQIIRFPLDGQAIPAPKAVIPKPAFFEVYDEFRMAAEKTANQRLKDDYLPPTKPEKPKAYPAPAPAPAAYPGPETKR